MEWKWNGSDRYLDKMRLSHYHIQVPGLVYNLGRLDILIIFKLNCTVCNKCKIFYCQDRLRSSGSGVPWVGGVLDWRWF